MASERTQEAYAYDWRAFVLWRGYDHQAPTVDELRLWAEHRAENGISWATIRRGLDSVGQRLEHGSLADLRTTTDQIRRLIGVRQVKARPIRAEDLARALRKLPDTPRGMRTRALFLCMWNGALRVSEAEAMQWDHMEWSAHGVALLLPRSKTDQYGEGETVALPRHPIERLCTCKALELWRNIAPNGPWVWQHIGKRGNTNGEPVSSLRQLVHGELRKAGFGVGYSSHSFRAGWITEAAAAGITESAMMMQTRHRTPRILQGYIREARLWDDNPAAQVARRLG